ncbi:hypothetical protein H0H93_006768 [Arthromyces matolae]|nr:hypothetical protein H0H93_006768 [Arthromyces matolae]
MRTRRVLSHFTVALFLVALVGLHVTRAYPINDNLAIRPKAKEASHGPSTTPTSSAEPPTVHDNPSVAVAKPESPPDEYADCFVNAKGLRRKKDDHGHPGETIWDPATHAVPLKIQPKWLDFQIGDCPELKSSNDPDRLRLRAHRVERIEEFRSGLKNWWENKSWVRESQIKGWQTEIVDQLWRLTRSDLEDVSSSGLERYKPVILNRMLTVLQIHETPLSWGTSKENLQHEIESQLDGFQCALEDFYGEGSGYDDALLHDVKRLTEKIELDLEKEKHKGTADIHAHS